MERIQTDPDSSSIMDQPAHQVRSSMADNQDCSFPEKNRLAMENGTFSQMIAAGVAQGSVSFYILYQPCFKQLNTSQNRATLLTRILGGLGSGVPYFVL